MTISEMNGIEYAGFWRRALASLLDNVVWVLFYLWIYVWIVGARRRAMAPIRGGAEPIATETAAEETPSPEEGSRRGLLPEIDWGPRQAFLGLLAALLLSAFLPAIFVAPFDPDLSGAGSLIAAQFLLGASLVAVPIAIATNWKWRRWRDALPMFGFRRFRASAFQLAALAWFTYFIASAVYAAIVVEPKQEDVGGQLGVGDANLVIAITAVALVAVVGPMWEELFFRGFLFSGLRQSWSFWPAALVSGFLFGLVHAPEGITIVVPLGILGTALAWLYQRTGSLWPCIGIHWFNNALALALAPLLGNSTLHALI